MTIFFEIAKHFLLEGVRDIKNVAIEADACVSNRVFTFMGVGRNKVLSTQKQDLAQVLIGKITELADEQDDEDNLEVFKNLLLEYKGLASKKSGPAGEGNFGPAIDALTLLLQDISWRFKDIEQRPEFKTLKIKLLNVAHDGDPWNIFRYHMAFYLAHKIQEAKDPGYVAWMTKYPKISKLGELVQEKETAIYNTLVKCVSEFVEPVTKVEISAESRKRRVKEALEALERENTRLVELHSIALKIPLSYSFLPAVTLNFGSIGPRPGFLKTCVRNALSEIEAEPIPQQDTRVGRVARDQVARDIASASREEDGRMVAYV